MNPRRWSLLAVGAAVIALACVSTLTAHGRAQHRDLAASPVEASARHPAESPRHSETTPLSPAPEVPSAPPPPPAPVRVAPRPEPRMILEIVSDSPDAPESSPTGFQDVFPARVAGTAGGADRPCFDQLQGVRGLCPCPAATPRLPAP